MLNSIASNYANRVDEYVATRPEYPAALLSDLPSADTIIELGAGTGKFTRLLSLTGKRILAVEPIEAMAARIQVDRLARVEVLIGTAEAIPAPDNIADLVCCATAFHWFDYARATCEILRVLKKDGTLVLIHNARDDRVPWVAEFCKVVDSYTGSAPRRSSGDAIFSDLRFVGIAKKTYTITHSMPPSALVDRAFSTSFIASLSPSDLKMVHDRILAISKNDPALIGKDEIEFPYVTELHVFRKRV